LVFCEIINSNKEEIHITDNNDQTIILKRGENISQHDQILDYMSEYNDIEFKDVKIYCKFDLFGKYNNNVKIIDSPGFDIIKTQNVINNKINNKEDDIDIVIAVIKCQDKITKTMHEYLKKLYSEKKTKHIFFVINHFHTNSRSKRNRKAKQRENEKKRIEEIEESIKDISKESYANKEFFIHHVCLYFANEEDRCPLENPVDKFNKFKSCLEKYVGLFNIYYKFELQISFFEDYIEKSESVSKDIIEMHEKEKTELENKKEENEEQINLFDKFKKNVSDQINNYINKNEQQVIEDIKGTFDTFYGTSDKNSHSLSNEKMIGIFKEILKSYIKSNIMDIKEIYCKNISSFKHENKVMEEKIKDKLKNFYIENDINKDVSLSVDEIINSQSTCSSSVENKLNLNLINNASNTLMKYIGIDSLSNFFLNKWAKKNIYSFYSDVKMNTYLLYGAAGISFIYFLASYYYQRKKGETIESIEKQKSFNKWINIIYEQRNLILKKFEKDYTNMIDSEIKELKDSNEQLNLEIINEKDIITNINENIKILDDENTKLKEYFNNIVILVR